MTAIVLNDYLLYADRRNLRTVGDLINTCVDMPKIRQDPISKAWYGITGQSPNDGEWENLFTYHRLWCKYIHYATLEKATKTLLIDEKDNQKIKKYRRLTDVGRLKATIYSTRIGAFDLDTKGRLPIALGGNRDYMFWVYPGTGTKSNITFVRIDGPMFVGIGSDAAKIHILHRAGLNIMSAYNKVSHYSSLISGKCDCVELLDYPIDELNDKE